MHLPATPAHPRDRSLVARLANAKTTSLQSPSQVETACATFSSSTTCRRRNPLTIDYPFKALDNILFRRGRRGPVHFDTVQRLDNSKMLRQAVGRDNASGEFKS